MVKFIKIFVFLVVFLVVSLVAALFFIPEKINFATYKGQIETYLKGKTGYTVSLGENVDIRLLPYPHFTSENMSVKAFHGNKNLFDAKKVDLELSLRELFSMNFAIKKLHLESPSIYMHSDIEKTANWEPKRVKSNYKKPVDLSFMKGLGSIVVSNAQFVYENDLTGKRVSLLDAQLGIDGSNLNKTNLTFSGALNDEKVSSNIIIDLSNVDDSAVEGVFNLSGNELTFKGFATDIFKEPAFDGDLTLVGDKVFESFYKIAAVAPNQRYIEFPVDIQTSATISHEAYKLTNLKVAIPTSETSVEVVADAHYILPKTSRGVGELNLNLRSDSYLDLNHFNFCQKAKGKKGGDVWSNELLDFAFLSQMKVNLALEAADGLSCRGLTVDNFKTQVAWGEGRLDIREFLANKAGGQLRADAYVNARGQQPKGALKIHAKAFDLTQLSNGAKAKRFLLPLDGEVDLIFSGQTMAEWAESLSGTVYANSNDLQTVGFRVGSLQSAFQFLFGLVVPNYQGEMDKGQLSFTGKVSEGVLRTNDGKIKLPGLTVDITGKADLTRLTLNMRAVPVTGNTLGFDVPVLIKGKASNPLVIPEVSKTQAQGAAIGASVGGPAGAVLGSVIGTILNKDEAKATSQTENEEKTMEKQNLKDELLEFLQSQ